jgi:glyoxylase-like metal-dependent hydrolase (beta-lactamase superfamily II)
MNESILKSLPFESSGEYKVHMLTSSSKSFLTNAFLVETEQLVIAIDAMMTISDAKRLSQEIESIGKPLIALLITHPHPDHYNGAAILVQGKGGIPIISTTRGKEVIELFDDIKEKKWKPIFGDDWPSIRILPNKYVSDKETLVFDGLPFVTAELGPGESHWDVCWIVGTKQKVAFVGDVVFGGVHSFMSDGHGQAWLAMLDCLETLTSEVELIFSGHGQPGRPKEMISAQRIYITEYYRKVKQLAQGRLSLSQEEKEQLYVYMKSILCSDELDFFIYAGADAVAKEIVMGTQSTSCFT